ncbi:uncharacterized protein LOC141594475 [Silene latifolia]|uniref:uncharacterized protein LOC141594475 n=1 Tax=Silene latifolia TaxID=37657 RepID=UPI003D785111
MSFTSDDYGKDIVANEISTTRDGYIRIRRKGLPEGYGWTCQLGFSDSIIMLLIAEDIPMTLFEVVRVKDGVVALRNVETGKFCRRGWLDDPDHLSASTTSIINEAQFQVVETVFSRSVQVLDFDLDNSRIYNLTPISSNTHTYQNPTEEVQEASMDLIISTTKTSTWNNNVSVKVGVETSFTTGIPLIAEGKITGISRGFLFA